MSGGAIPPTPAPRVDFLEQRGTQNENESHLIGIQKATCMVTHALTATETRTTPIHPQVILPLPTFTTNISLWSNLAHMFVFAC